MTTNESNAPLTEDEKRHIFRLLEACPAFSLIKLPQSDPRAEREFRISVVYAAHLNQGDLELLYNTLNEIGKFLGKRDVER